MVILVLKSTNSLHSLITLKFLKKITIHAQQIRDKCGHQGLKSHSDKDRRENQWLDVPLALPAEKKEQETNAKKEPGEQQDAPDHAEEPESLVDNENS